MQKYSYKFVYKLFVHVFKKKKNKKNGNNDELGRCNKF